MAEDAGNIHQEEGSHDEGEIAFYHSVPQASVMDEPQRKRPRQADSTISEPTLSVLMGMLQEFRVESRIREEGLRADFEILRFDLRVLRSDFEALKAEYEAFKACLRAPETNHGSREEALLELFNHLSLNAPVPTEDTGGTQSS